MTSPHRTWGASTKDRARGRWRELLPHFGIEERFLTGINCPCPICGGTDRFRFIDRKGRDGDGMWVCNQCAPKPRPAIELLMKFTGKPFKIVAREVDVLLGGVGDTWWRIKPPSPPKPEPPLTFGSYQRKVWNRGARVQVGDAVDRYLRSRGVGLDIYPNSLRTSSADWYRDDKTGNLERYPAMLALVHNIAGERTAVHRTFLAHDGSGKAPVEKPRKIAGRHGPGPTIRLTPPGSTMGIAEGVETALSAAKLFGIPTWSVISTYGTETFEPPPIVEQLVIFADNDANGAGQRAAEALATRLAGRITVEVMIPERPGTDWNDLLRERTL
jgi:putative DNA primase/helicase